MTSAEIKAQGYRAPQVCKLVGITYRQLDYWARTGLLTPSLQDAHGSGTQRLYSFSDVVQLKVIKKLLDAGMSLKKIRQAMDILRTHLATDRPLEDVTLLSDGTTIFAAHSPDDVFDVFRGGQGVLGIAVRPVEEELEGQILELFPGEQGTQAVEPTGDATEADDDRTPSAAAGGGSGS